MNNKKEISEVSSNILGLELINTSNSKEDKYVIYSVIKVLNYETSQGEITIELINPIEEFEKICNDFKINFQNECSYNDYNKAKEIKLLSFGSSNFEYGYSRFPGQIIRYPIFLLILIHK